MTDFAQRAPLHEPDAALTLPPALVPVRGLEPRRAAPWTILPAAGERGSRRDRATLVALRVADVVGLALAGTAARAAGAEDAAGVVLFAVAAVLVLQACGLYARTPLVVSGRVLDVLPRLLQSLTVAAGLVVVAGSWAALAPRGVAAAWTAAVVLVPAARLVARQAVVRVTPDERLLIVGSGVIADLVAKKIAAHPELGIAVVGCLDHVGEHERTRSVVAEHLGHLRDVERVLQEQRIDTVVIAFSAVPHEELLDAIRHCKRAGVKISIVPRLFEVTGSRIELHDVEGLTLLGLHGATRSAGARAAKRAFDVAGAAAALVVLAPLMGAIALAIRLTSRGPAVFRQERIGRGHEPFSILKFRTMVVDADAQKASLRHLNEAAGGRLFKIVADPRVTRVGRLLRATSLDELPQFVNVLRGEMSIVGPRPLVHEEDAEVLGWHRTRLDLKPGLTGPWQVLGRQQVSFEEMVKLDYLYVAEWSLWNDVKLALRTVPVMLRRTGA